jgi:DNA-directed RNA polymerase specialized sigma subunit, sigma24 homolog
MDPSTDFERCYRRHRQKLWRSLLLFSADPDVASDAMAEAFAQALRRGDDVRNLDRWVWRTAFAIARGELQRRSAVEPLVDMPQEMPEPTVDMVRALEALSPKQRASVVLHHYAGYSTRETAAIIGSTAAAVGVHLQRARVRLRTLLEEDDDV